MWLDGAINGEGSSALLEFIKECYPICDLETFAQRVLSSLSKNSSHKKVSNNKRRNACETYPRANYTPFGKQDVRATLVQVGTLFITKIDAPPEL